MIVEDLTKLQERLNVIFNSMRIHECLAITSPRPDTRLMYRRMAAKEKVQAQELQDEINLFISKGIPENV